MPTDGNSNSPSKCDGLAQTASCMILLVVLFNRSWVIPKWYLTSPLPSSSGSSEGLNWVKICSSGLRQTFANTFNLPLKNWTANYIGKRHTKHPRSRFTNDAITTKLITLFIILIVLYNEWNKSNISFNRL